jgi:putative hydrolase of the HAD superfamily
LAAISLVAFDLDDTLYPERAFVRSGFHAVSEYLVRAGVVDRPVAADLEAAFDAGVRGRTFNHVLEALDIEPSEKLIRDLVGIYRSHRSPYGFVRPDIRLHPDADRALADLRARGFHLGLISDGPLDAQQVKVDALGLAERLDAVVLTEAFGREYRKPHPRAFRDLAECLGVPAEACIYVADNPSKDFQGPAAAGWRPSIRVLRPGGLYGDAPLSEPRLVAAMVSSLDGLAGLLESLSCPQ